jgi:hypothetical protein
MDRGHCLNCGRPWVKADAKRNKHGCRYDNGLGSNKTVCPHCGWCECCDEVRERTRSVSSVSGKQGGGFMNCTHPDHNDRESCEDRAVACSRDCECCNTLVRLPVEQVPTWESAWIDLGGEG